MNERILAPDEINAAPTKSFFVDMLVRDIPLEQAVLDLVDNSIDGAKRLEADDFDGREVVIVISPQQFRILDNCGGFDKKTARDYAFRFGRPSDTPVTPHSIGQFGVGMKRALFKFGRHFVVRSATKQDRWAIDVDVAKWEKDPDDWHFHWAEFGDETEISKKVPGTDIVVDKLRPEVAARFESQLFLNSISGLIKSKHRQFIASGLRITVNGDVLDASDLSLLQSRPLQPAVDIRTFGSGRNAVKIKIIVGLAESSPKEAGWFVICNGRVIVEADRRPETGWGLMEQDEKQVVIPSYHNQFARFRGIVSFDSRDSAQLPWNTTKTDIDQDRPIWQQTFQRMTEMMRPVIDFLNELDKDIDEFGREDSPLLQVVRKAAHVATDTMVRTSVFKAPKRSDLPKKKQPENQKIIYSRPKKDVSLLEDALGVSSANEVGEKTFDLILSRHKKK